MRIKSKEEIRTERPCPDTIDPTIGGTVDECMRKFFYRHIAGISPLVEPDYFTSGRAWDAAHKAFFAADSPQIGYINAVKAIHETYARSSCRFPREKRSAENLVNLFDRYVTRWEEPSYRVVDSNVAFRLPFDDFWLGGEMDAYCDWPRYNVVVHENKTTTIIPGSRGWDSYADGFSVGRYANQVTHYVWAASQLAEDVWGARVLVACLDIPKRETTKRQLFEAIWLLRNDIKIDEYLNLCRYRMARIRGSWKTWHWPKEGQSCSGGWGFSRCEYFPLCHMHYSFPEIEVPEGMYRVDVPWAPWDGEKGDTEK